MHVQIWLLLCGLVLAMPSNASTFELLESSTPNLSGGSGWRISGDGSIIVGAGSRPIQIFHLTINAPFLIEWADPALPEEIAPDVVLRNYLALSADGSTIAASASDQIMAPIPPLDVFRFRDTGIEQLTLNQNLRVRGISSDGEIIVTHTSRFDGAVETPLPFEAQEISDDGSTIVGSIDMGTFEVAAMSVDGAAPFPLPLPADADPQKPSIALHTSSDGSVVVGHYLAAGSSIRVFRWSGGTTEAIGDYDFDLRISGDGQVILGRHQIWVGSQRYDTLEFFQLLELPIDDWTDMTARDASDDGTVLVGDGKDPFGVGRSWVVTIPEPGANLMSPAGALLLGALARRRGGSMRP